jgi:hypothetical protein
MTRFSARIVGPEELTADELRRALEAIGCYLEAQPMRGNQPALKPAFQSRASTAPDLAPRVSPC